MAVGDASVSEICNMGSDLMKLAAGQMGSSAAVAQNNFLTTNKFVDANSVMIGKAQELDYLEGHRTVDLNEATGTREVATSGPGTGPASPAK